MLNRKNVFSQADALQWKQSADAGLRTTRRLDADAEPSLAKRRKWFTDPPPAPVVPPVPPNPGDPAGDPEGDTHGDWFKGLPPTAQREIEDLRKENAKARQDRTKAQDDARKAEEKRLTEQSEWKTLAEQRLVEIERLKPLEARFTTLEEDTKATNAKRIAAIPDNMKSLVPPNAAPLELRDWLDLNAAIFAAPRAPQMGAGAQGDGTGGAKPKLTPDQQATARKFGLTDEEFIKNL